MGPEQRPTYQPANLTTPNPALAPAAQSGFADPYNWLGLGLNVASLVARKDPAGNSVLTAGQEARTREDAKALRDYQYAQSQADLQAKDTQSGALKDFLNSNRTKYSGSEADIIKNLAETDPHRGLSVAMQILENKDRSRREGDTVKRWLINEGQQESGVNAAQATRDAEIAEHTAKNIEHDLHGDPAYRYSVVRDHFKGLITDDKMRRELVANDKLRKLQVEGAFKAAGLPTDKTLINIADKQVLDAISNSFWGLPGTYSAWAPDIAKRNLDERFVSPEQSKAIAAKVGMRDAARADAAKARKSADEVVARRTKAIKESLAPLYKQYGINPALLEGAGNIPGAAQQSPERTVVKRGYNAKTNQTQLLYSDGTSEILSGRH